MRPIFIGGMFKSGTSLLRAMIGNHSKVASGLETYWFDIDWSNLDEAKNRDRLRIISEFYELSDQALNGMIKKCFSSEDFLARLMAHWCAINKKERWAEKTPGNIIHIDRIKAFWPDAYILHIVRDPRDIFASLRDAKKWDDIGSFMDRWGAVFDHVKKFKSSGVLDETKYLEVRYEELVCDPKAVMEKICRFTDLEFETEISSFKGKKGEFDKVKSVTGKESTTLARLSEPMTKARLGIWKKILHESEVKELACAAASIGLGDAYEEACL
jgi:protein-tyrosine sulfotransferase